MTILNAPFALRKMHQFTVLRTVIQTSSNRHDPNQVRLHSVALARMTGSRRENANRMPRSRRDEKIAGRISSFLPGTAGDPVRADRGLACTDSPH
jgi:hypothetical protein